MSEKKPSGATKTGYKIENGLEFVPEHGLVSAYKASAGKSYSDYLKIWKQKQLAKRSKNLL